MELWQQGLTAATELYEWAVARVRELLAGHMDPALARPVFNAALVVVGTTIVLGFVLVFRCLCRPSHKKSR